MLPTEFQVNWPFGSGEEAKNRFSEWPPWSYLISNLKDFSYFLSTVASLGGSVGCTSDWRPGGCWFDPCRVQQHSFVEIDHEIFSTVILSLPLIRGGQLSGSGERMCTILVNSLED